MEPRFDDFYFHYDSFKNMQYDIWSIIVGVKSVR